MLTSISLMIASGNLRELPTYQAALLNFTAEKNVAAMYDSVLEPYGLTSTHWLFLGIIADSGEAGVRVTDIARLLNRTLAFSTQTANLLERHAYIERSLHSNDGRAKLVHIHPSFTPVLQRIEADLRDRLRKTLYSHISPEDFRTYLRVLDQLAHIER